MSELHVLDASAILCAFFHEPGADKVAAALRNATRYKGLSLEDRACLARAASRDAVAVTTDRTWKQFEHITPVLLVR